MPWAVFFAEGKGAKDGQKKKDDKEKQKSSSSGRPQSDLPSAGPHMNYDLVRCNFYVIHSNFHNDKNIATRTIRCLCRWRINDRAPSTGNRSFRYVQSKTVFHRNILATKAHRKFEIVRMSFVQRGLLLFKQCF